MMSLRFLRTSYSIYSQTRFLNNSSKYILPLFIKSVKFPITNTINIQINQTRNYAKGKDKKKSDKGKKQKIAINEEQLQNLINYESFQNSLQKSIEKLKDDYIKNISLRSSSGSIESLSVTFEGNKYNLNDLGQVIRKNPKTLVINMINFPQAIPNVLKVLSNSGMNLNPQQDGTTLFIPIPKISKEHRENLAKNAKALFIKCRDNLKDIQNKYIKNIKNNKKLSEDESFDIQGQITYITEQYLTQANELFEDKINELIGKSE